MANYSDLILNDKTIMSWRNAVPNQEESYFNFIFTKQDKYSGKIKLRNLFEKMYSGKYKEKRMEECAAFIDEERFEIFYYNDVKTIKSRLDNIGLTLEKIDTIICDILDISKDEENMRFVTMNEDEFWDNELSDELSDEEEDRLLNKYYDVQKKMEGESLGFFPILRRIRAKLNEAPNQYNLFLHLTEGMEAVLSERKYLFSLDRSEYEKYLEEGPIHDELRIAFEKEGYEIEENIELYSRDGWWEIETEGKDRWIKKGDEKINIYEEIKFEDLCRNYELVPYSTEKKIRIERSHLERAKVHFSTHDFDLVYIRLIIDLEIAINKYWNRIYKNFVFSKKCNESFKESLKDMGKDLGLVDRLKFLLIFIGRKDINESFFDKIQETYDARNNVVHHQRKNFRTDKVYQSIKAVEQAINMLHDLAIE